MIQRSRNLLPEWQDLADRMIYAPKTGFYYFKETAPASRGHRKISRLLDTLGRLFPVNKENTLRRALARLFGWINRKPLVAGAVKRIELAVKKPFFGCRECGNCVLGHLEYVCPQTCPKQMRNGPCGGTHHGQCEVIDQPCIWGNVYDSAKAESRVKDLMTFIPPPDRNLQGTSSWIQLLPK